MKDSGRDRKMVRKKKACKCLQVISLAAFVVFLFIFSLASLSDKQIRNMVKNYIFRLVEVNEEQLSCLAGKYAQENHSFMIHQYQRGEKKVRDKEVSRAFRNFNLYRIFWRWRYSFCLLSIYTGIGRWLFLWILL